MARILCEAYNATRGAGTGIRTYIHGLVAAAHAAGHVVDGLLHSFRSLRPSSKYPIEIDFFDSSNRKISAADAYISVPLRKLIGVPFGVRATRLPSRSDSFVLDAMRDSPWGAFSDIYAAKLFSELARAHFARYGVAASINVPYAPDIFHATHAVPVKVRGGANIYTIHDIIPLRLPSSTLDNKKYFYKLVRHLAKTADHIVTVSECSRRDIIAVTGMDEKRITNTYQAVHIPAHVRERSEAEVAATIENVFGLGYKDYFIFIGAVEPKKNISRLVDAYLASGSKRRLVIAGGLGWDYNSDLEKIERKEYARMKIQTEWILQDDRIRRYGHLPADHVLMLLSGARALVFPSLYEGFGLPVLEAMTLGTAVIASNSSSLPEVTGDAGRLVNPIDTAEMAKAISDLDQDDALLHEFQSRGRRQAANFSAEIYSKRIGDLYRSLV